MNTTAGQIITWSVLTAPGASVLTPWSILTATAGLIAFLIGLYTLVARDRKSPYIINSVFPIFLLCLVIAALSVTAALLPSAIAQWTLFTSAILLVVTFLYSAFRVFQIAIRFVYFVDGVRLRQMPGIRQWRRRKSLHSPKSTYAHNAIRIADDLKDEIVDALKKFGDKSWENRSELDPQALAVAIEHQGQGNSLLADLACAFLTRGFTVQYLTASRHPIEFIVYLRRFLESKSKDWLDNASHIVVIDAYSPHFGFLDSIYPKKDRELEGLNITSVISKQTYAGMHSASSRAFNVIQEQVKHDTRKPTLVIYEEAYALTDLESPEQYRIFVRHVMPSERMWDGMFTVFLESTQPEADWKMLQAYASMRLDLRSGPADCGATAATSDSVNPRHT